MSRHTRLPFLVAGTLAFASVHDARSADPNQYIADERRLGYHLVKAFRDYTTHDCALSLTIGAENYVPTDLRNQSWGESGGSLMHQPVFALHSKRLEDIFAAVFPETANVESSFAAHALPTGWQIPKDYFHHDDARPKMEELPGAEARVRHRCSTAIGANAKVSAGISSIASVTSLLEAETKQLTLIDLWLGRFISPLEMMLKPTNRWRRTLLHAAWFAASKQTKEERFVYLKSFEGAYLARMKDNNAGVKFSANAKAGGGFVFFSASGDLQTTAEMSSSFASQVYSVFVLGDIRGVAQSPVSKPKVGLDSFPKLDEIATELSSPILESGLVPLIRLQRDNKSSPHIHHVRLVGVREACVTSAWKVSAPTITTGTVTSIGVSSPKTVEDQGVADGACDLTVTTTLQGVFATKSIMTLGYTLENTLPFKSMNGAPLAIRVPVSVAVTATAEPEFTLVDSVAARSVRDGALEFTVRAKIANTQKYWDETPIENDTVSFRCQVGGEVQEAAKKAVLLSPLNDRETVSLTIRMPSISVESEGTTCSATATVSVPVKDAGQGKPGKIERSIGPFDLPIPQRATP